MAASIWINPLIQAHMKLSPGLKESFEFKKLAIQELWILRSQVALSFVYKGTKLIYKFRATRLVKSQQSAGK